MLFAVVGVVDVYQQTPLAVILDPVIVPPEEAVIEAIDETAVVVTTGSVVTVTSTEPLGLVHFPVAEASA
jgi:methylmalonyl-CoA mutase cobalamin-binding subunit